MTIKAQTIYDVCCDECGVCYEEEVGDVLMCHFNAEEAEEAAASDDWDISDGNHKCPVCRDEKEEAKP